MNPLLVESSARAYVGRRYYKEGFRRGLWYGFTAASLVMTALCIFAAGVWG